MPIAASARKRTTISIDATRLIRQSALGIKDLVKWEEGGEAIMEVGTLMPRV
jgi:hypothetical protein